jgi:hypothetical protein
MQGSRRSSSSFRPLNPGRLRTVASAAAAVLVLALPAYALAASKFRLTAHFATHTPIINKPWPLTVYVTKGTTKLSGTVKYQFLFAGTVVSTQPTHGSYKFKNGVYKDTLTFPKNSLGEPLTFRVVVKTTYGTEHADWAVTSKQ